MALANRIKVTTATTGTGALTLSATGVRDATNGDCLAPAELTAVMGNQIAPYFITSGNNFAHGSGLVSVNGLILTRDPFERSWNGTVYAAALLSLTGTSTVIFAPRADDLSAAGMGITIAARLCAFTL